MPLAKTLEKRVQYRIKRQKTSVFLIADFLDLGNKNQIRRILKKLLEKNLLVKVGQGLYARARISTITNQPVPDNDIRTIAIEALNKLNVKVYPTMYERMYEEGISIQVPTGRVIGVKNKISRKIGFNGHYIKYGKAD